MGQETFSNKKFIDELKSSIQPDTNGYDYTEVSISAAEMLTLGSVGKNLLPAPGENKYYEINRMIVEFTYGTSAYSLADYLVFGTQHVTSNLIIGNQFTPKKVVIINNPISEPSWDGVEGKLVEFAYTLFSYVNASVDAYTYLGNDPTGGDGTALVKIWYKVRTFGSEV